MGVKIANYQVIVSRATPDAGEVRHLYLEADDSETGVFKHFAVYFYEADPNRLGYMRIKC